MRRSRNRRRSDAGPVKRPSMAGMSQIISTWSASAPEPDWVSPSMRTMRPELRPGRPSAVRPFGQAGADIELPERRVEARRHRPARRAHARKLGIGRAAQPLARRQQRDGFQQVGLAGAVGAGEHDGAGTDAQRQAPVVAEIGELQPLDPDAPGGGGIDSRAGIGGIGSTGGCHLARDASVPHQTRIGMRT